ncbi:MAG: magnesium-protoporphyrin IX monomethyl ester (oxidative) cyclase, partial [Alphaproteobacteria bacterium]|nr:magnesium-protoporphyrin IX monomethyl ester (oxidative) cyclase [Alphaproteobacteria bacterium]
LLMRANPKLTQGTNRLWIRFFQLAVFATMFVRDHARPAFHDALRMSPTDYDMRVFRITTDICKQVFPVTLDIDNPAFLRGLQRLRETTEAMGRAKAEGGLMGRIKQTALTASAAFSFARLFMMRANKEAPPADVRMAPAW